MKLKEFKAPKGKVYVHKDKPYLFGEVVVITGEEDYTIDDFKLLTKNKHETKLKKYKNSLGDDNNEG